MSEGAKQRIAWIDARITFIDTVIQAARKAAEDMRRTTHTVHLEYGPAVHEMMDALDREKIGLNAEKTKLSIFSDDRPIKWGSLL